MNRCKVQEDKVQGASRKARNYVFFLSLILVLDLTLHLVPLVPCTFVQFLGVNVNASEKKASSGNPRSAVKSR